LQLSMDIHTHCDRFGRIGGDQARADYTNELIEAVGLPAERAKPGQRAGLRAMQDAIMVKMECESTASLQATLNRRNRQEGYGVRKPARVAQR
jgi:hypothetical protein